MNNKFAATAAFALVKLFVHFFSCYTLTDSYKHLSVSEVECSSCASLLNHFRGSTRIEIRAIMISGCFLHHFSSSGFWL